MKTKIVECKGFKMHTRVDRSKQDIDVINEVLVHDCYRLEKLSKIIQPKVILDVGGHIGTFGVLAKKYWPSATLIALEPNKVSFELYLKNVKENIGDRDCHIINAAVGYNANKNILMGGSKATGGGMMKAKKEAEQLQSQGVYHIEYTEVKVLTLEEIVENYNINRIDLAKWDCEGGERDAFKYVKKETAQRFRYMCGEYHIAGGSSAFVKLVKEKFSHLTVSPRRGFNHPAHIELFAIFPKDKIINNYF